VILGNVLVAILFWLQTLKDGIYTAEQAGRGKEVYASSCTGCHGQTLEGSGQIPPLAGEEFLNNWKGQTLADLFDKMKTTMPADSPGKLTNEENIDVIAYILSINKFPSGSNELKYDRQFLQRIRIE
jgi:mono/diheme cytochrome c family protein